MRVESPLLRKLRQHNDSYPMMSLALEIKVYADRVQVGLAVEGKFSAHRKRGKKEGRANVRSVNFPSNIVFASNFSLRKALRDR